MNLAEITVPGVYDIPADLYHADPVACGSLSASGALLLLPPNCPARYRWDRDHPKPPTEAMELGTAVHRLVLGDGPNVVQIDADEWRSKAVKAEVAEVRAGGGIPLRPKHYQVAQDMAAAVRAHPEASALFKPGAGKPEQSLIWRTGQVWRRSRFDWLPNTPPKGQRLIIPDLKTSHTASPEELDGIIYDLGYHIKARWYLDGVSSLGLAGDQDPVFVLVFVEKEPPYLVQPVQLDGPALRIAGILTRQALDIYQQCTESGRWPGYSDEVEIVGLPRWVEAQYEREISR